MRKIVMCAHADTVGTDTKELIGFPDTVTSKELDEYAQEFGQAHWESYDSSSNEEEYHEYIEACDSWWEEYNEEEHSWMEVQKP